MDIRRTNNETFEVIQSTLIFQTDIHQAEMKAKMDVHQERMEAATHSMRAWWKEMMACEEVMEACLESNEPTSVEIESIAVHEDVPKEEAT
jgi:hypothetical protein